MERARQVRAHLHPEELSTRKQVKSIGTVHASEEWLMAPVVRNFERHSLVSSTQKRNPRESIASRNFKICRTASESTLRFMLTVGLFILFKLYTFLLGVLQKFRMTTRKNNLHTQSLRVLAKSMMTRLANSPHHRSLQ